MFSILKHLDKLLVIKDLPTEYTTLCPVCNGKLKINKTTGAYACYTENCESKDIRNKIAPLDGQYINLYTNQFESILSSAPLELPKPFYLVNLKKNYKYTSVKKRQGQLIYYFSKRQRMIRFESEVSKSFCPQVLQHGDWLTGTNNETFPFYNQFLLEQKHVNLHPRLPNIVLVAEGEKKSNITTALTGVVVLSPAGFCYSEKHLLKMISRVSKYVSGFIYLPDNDKPGRKKASLFERSCTKLEIPCQIANLTRYFSTDDTAEDILDIIENQQVCSARQLTDIVLER